MPDASVPSGVVRNAEPMMAPFSRCFFFCPLRFGSIPSLAAMADSSSNPSHQILNSATFSRPGPSVDRNSAEPLAAPSAASVLAARGYDPAALHPLAQANTGELDYLVLDDDALNSLEGARGVLPSRGWGDELCYGTGTTYLGGKSSGCALAASFIIQGNFVRTRPRRCMGPARGPVQTGPVDGRCGSSTDEPPVAAQHGP
jgi:hypothetical protein